MSTHEVSHPSVDDLDVLRRKLAFRAWHRGTREADLLIGTFADRNLAGFDRRMLDAFERLLGENDPDLYDWMTGRTPPPPEHDTPVMALMIAHRFAVARP
jgi:antitoxin CptB